MVGWEVASHEAPYWAYVWSTKQLVNFLTRVEEYGGEIPTIRTLK